MVSSQGRRLVQDAQAAQHARRISGVQRKPKMISAALWLFNNVIGLYLFVVIATVILSWLIAFNVVNLHHPVVYQINRILNALTEPVLRPLRRMLPSLGGMDFSPIVLFLILGFIQRLVNNVVITGSIL